MDTARDFKTRSCALFPRIHSGLHGIRGAVEISLNEQESGYPNPARHTRQGSRCRICRGVDFHSDPDAINFRIERVLSNPAHTPSVWKFTFSHSAPGSAYADLLDHFLSFPFLAIPRVYNPRAVLVRPIHDSDGPALLLPRFRSLPVSPPLRSILRLSRASKRPDSFVPIAPLFPRRRHILCIRHLSTAPHSRHYPFRYQNHHRSSLRPSVCQERWLKTPENLESCPRETTLLSPRIVCISTISFLRVVTSRLFRSTMGAPHRRTIYIASLEAHIDRLHNQLLGIGLYPIPFERLEPYRGLNSKTAKVPCFSIYPLPSQSSLPEHGRRSATRRNCVKGEALGTRTLGPCLFRADSHLPDQSIEHIHQKASRHPQLF